MAAAVRQEYRFRTIRRSLNAGRVPMFQLPAAGIVRTAGFNVHVAPLSLIERRPLISGLVGPVAARLDYPAMNKVPHKIRNVGLAVALRQRLAQRYRQ